MEGEKKKAKRMHIIGLTLLTLLLLPLPAWSKAVHLFSIQRSKNANEVHYRLHVNDHCHLVSDTPVDAVWHLWADSPEKTTPLTAVEHLAYGAVQQHVAENWVSFHLRPCHSGGSKPRPFMIPTRPHVPPASTPKSMSNGPPWSGFMCTQKNSCYAPRSCI
jgi:hypothetical protein